MDLVGKKKRKLESTFLCQGPNLLSVSLLKNILLKKPTHQVQFFKGLI